MVLAIEPMVNAGGKDVALLGDGWTVVTVDHSLSAYFEHSVAITPDGPEILTALRRDPGRIPSSLVGDRSANSPSPSGGGEGGGT
jgi:hypothetical protein